MNAFRFRQHYRMNRLVALLVALLLSNVAALACATAYALCIDCPEQQPVVCAHEDPCTTADVIGTKPSTDALGTTYRPIVYAGPPITTDLTTVSARDGIAANGVNVLRSSLPLNLLFCVFLN
jgi:hypothetical protein